MRVPNVRSWGVGVSEPLSQLIRVRELPSLVLNPKDTPAEVHVKPVVGGKPEALMTLEHFRAEYPVLRTAFMLASELFDATNPSGGGDLGIGPTFDELLDVAQEYLAARVRAVDESDIRDIGIYYWRRRALDILETAIRGAGVAGVRALPVLSSPDYLDTESQRSFVWPGPTAVGRKSHTNKVPCHNPLEVQFADFLDTCKDVERYVKNERFGFSVTYYENNRPRQYYPDFVVAVRDGAGKEVNWVVETKGEIRGNTMVKREAAQLWCQKMSATQFGAWRHLLVHQRAFERALLAGTRTFSALVDALIVAPPEPQLKLFPLEDPYISGQAFKTLLPLYSLKAAAGYFGEGEAVEPEGWVDASAVGKLDEQMFVARVAGRSMEPQLHDGDYCVFRAKPKGPRGTRIVLAQYRGPADPDTDGSFTVKRYSSEKVYRPDGKWRHTRVTLSPLNPDFAPIILEVKDEASVTIVAELVAVLGAG